jgi:hypothetical protein
MCRVFENSFFATDKQILDAGVWMLAGAKRKSRPAGMK